MTQKTNWRGIVKVQRSLASNHAPAGSEVLIYSEDHSVEYRGPIQRKLLGWFPSGEHKIFAEAELRGTIVHLVRKAPWQEW